MKHSKIAIIGAGSVGTTTAYALMMKHIAAEIILVDINEKRCRGEILDLSDAISFCCTSKLKTGTIKEAGQADIIIIAAGARQKLDQPRSELININQKIIRSIIKDMQPIQKDAIIIMVTNPMDVLECVAQEESGLPKKQVLGSGTYLDSQRLRNILAQKLNIAEQSIQAYVLGEHGDSQFVAWSIAQIAGIPILDFPGITEKELETIATQTKNKVYELIECKGSTFYGIAACLADICSCILFNQKRIIPISSYHEKYQSCFSLPTVLGESGIEEVLPVKLNQKEQQLLEQSAEKIKTMLKDI